MDHAPGFIALYKGTTVSTAQIVGISAEEEIVEQFARLLSRSPTERTQGRPSLRLVPDEPPDDAA